MPHQQVYDTISPSDEDSVQAVRVALGAGGVSFDLISTRILKHRFAMEPHDGQLPNLPYSGHPPNPIITFCDVKTGAALASEALHTISQGIVLVLRIPFSRFQGWSLTVVGCRNAVDLRNHCFV